METTNTRNARHLEAVRAYYATNDEATLAELLADLAGLMAGFVRARLGIYDDEQAADAVQDGLARVLAALRAHTFDLQRPEPIGGWACAWARYAWLSANKKGRTTRPGADEDPLRHLASIGTEPDLLPDEAEHDAEASAAVEAATRAVLTLDPNARAAVVLHFYQGMPVPEAAQQLGLTEGTFRTRLQRGLTSLQQWAAGQTAPTADTYAALRRLNTGNLFTDYGLRLAS